jgi:hypothetical protein
MSTISIVRPTEAGSITTDAYLKNVGQAARSLIDALLAFAPRTLAAERTARVSSILRLYRLAAASDSVTPALADELQTMALRAAK